MRNVPHPRVGEVVAVLLSAVNLGVAVRFWWAVFTPPPPLTIDWTPAVYWLLGILLATAALQSTRALSGDTPAGGRTSLLGLNGLCFAGYLGVAAVIFSRSFATL